MESAQSQEELDATSSLWPYHSNDDKPNNFVLTAIETTTNPKKGMQMLKSTPFLQWSGILAVCCLATVGQAQITNQLVVHLPFDTNYNNTVANGVTATAQGTPVFAAGKIGGGVTVTTRKDGSEISYVTLGTPTELQF